MKPNRLFWALGYVTMGSLAALQGCGGDDDDAGTGGSGGSAGKGSGGSSGKATGGSAGKGTGGSAGSSTGGSAGKATGGTSGEGGMGGAEGGMGGEGGSGSTDVMRALACEAYCQMYNDKDCFEADADTYENEPTCRDVCMESDWEIGTAAETTGNTIHCRLTHATLASATNTPDELHCGHASENSTGNCVD